MKQPQKRPGISMFGKEWRKINQKKILETSPFKAPFNFTKAEKTTKRDFKGKRRSYLKERTKQKEHLNSQIANLEKLLNDKSINEDTYARYKKLLEMSYEQEREATREKYGFTNFNDNNPI